MNVHRHHPLMAVRRASWQAWGRARSQTMWHIDSGNILRACRFVPEGEPLPAEPDRPHWHTTERDETGFPIELGWCTADHMPSVREVLAQEAETDVVLVPPDLPSLVDVHLPEGA